VLDPIKPFHRGQSGTARLTVTKDRRGYLHRDHELAVQVVDGSITIELSEAEAVTPDGLSPAAGKILAVLREASGPLTNKLIGDAIKSKYGHGLTRETISRKCAELVSDGAADELSTGPHGRKEWIVMLGA
jgi:hypothetical protein